jgi:hypothetical protein
MGANAMETMKKVLMLLVLLQAGSLAHADDTNLPGSAQDSSKHLSRLDYLSAGFFARQEKSIPLEPPSTQGNPTEITAVPARQDPSSGLHWVPSEQHPTLEYRFSNEGAMSMHLSRHGAVAALALLTAVSNIIHKLDLYQTLL